MGDAVATVMLFVDRIREAAAATFPEPYFAEMASIVVIASPVVLAVVLLVKLFGWLFRPRRRLSRSTYRASPPTPEDRAPSWPKPRPKPAATVPLRTGPGPRDW